MKRIIKDTTVLMYVLGILVLLWFILNNVGSIKAKILITFIVAVVLIGKLFFSKLVTDIWRRINGITKGRNFPFLMVLVVLFVSLLIRFGFYFLYSYAPVSDPSSFFNSANSIASGAGLVGNYYVAFYPYLAAYDSILGIFINIIDDSWLAIIIMNTVFDILAAFIAMQFVKEITVIGSRKPIAVFALWLLNPFNLIFSVLSLPIVVVNFFIILIVYLMHSLSRLIIQKNTSSILIISVIFGFILGLANWFRPVFLVALIAVLLHLTYLAFSNKNSKKMIVIVASSFLIIFISFFGMQKLNTEFVTNATGIMAPSNASGWSIYVGSNTLATGSWNLEDNMYLSEKLNGNSNLQDVHRQLTIEGIERYKSYGIIGSLSLMIRKLAHFAGSQSSVYDIEASVVGYEKSIVAIFFSVYIPVFVFLVIIVGIKNLYQFARRILTGEMNNSIYIFVLLLIFGFFFSGMFVESQLRYAQIMYPLFIVLATLGLDSVVKYLDN